jgi:hypothetical protein
MGAAPSVLYHGTSLAVIDSIVRCGLMPGGLRGKRRHVHFAQVAEKHQPGGAYGVRSISEAVVDVDSLRVQNLGLPLCQSTAGVILCSFTVPSSCFLRIRDIGGPNRVYWEPSGAAPTGTAPGPSYALSRRHRPPWGRLPVGKGPLPSLLPNSPRRKRSPVGFLGRSGSALVGKSGAGGVGGKSHLAPAGEARRKSHHHPARLPATLVVRLPATLQALLLANPPGRRRWARRITLLSPATTCRLRYVRTATSAF